MPLFCPNSKAHSKIVCNAPQSHENAQNGTREYKYTLTHKKTVKRKFQGGYHSKNYFFMCYVV